MSSERWQVSRAQMSTVDVRWEKRQMDDKDGMQRCIPSPSLSLLYAASSTTTDGGLHFRSHRIVAKAREPENVNVRRSSLCE